MIGSLPFGLAMAIVLARGRFWGKSVLDGMVHLPLVMPPVVTGYLLLLLFGRTDRSADCSMNGSASSWHFAGPVRRLPLLSWAFRCWYELFGCRSTRWTAGWRRPRGPS